MNKTKRNVKSFCMTPKELFEIPKYKKISADAKLLYSLMLDRASLSEKNGWTDDDGKVYILFTLRAVSDAMNCCRDKAIKLLKELDTVHGVGLILRKKTGNGKPDHIYVCTPGNAGDGVDNTVDIHEEKAVENVWTPDDRLWRAVEIYERMRSENQTRLI